MIPQIAAAAIPAIIGAIGSSKAGKARKEGERIIDQAGENWDLLDVPDVEDLKYDAATQDYVGDVDPALMSQVPDINSAFDQITGDPRFQQAQYDSLGALDGLVNAGGMMEADKIAYQNALNDAATQNSRQQASIGRDYAERGLGGGGQELAMRMAAQQTAANANSAGAQNMAATAQQRALEAIMSRGNLAGSMQGADYAQKNAAATARDVINKFNTQNAITVGQSNQDAINTAGVQNQNTRQGVRGDNQNATNESLKYNAGAPVTQFGMAKDKASGQSDAAGQKAAVRTGQAAGIREEHKGYATAIPGVIQGASSIGQTPYSEMSGEGQDAYDKDRRPR